MRHHFEIRYENIKLRPLKKEDIEILREWRNDKETTFYLRDIGYITKEMQANWYESYENNKSELTFVIEEKNVSNAIVGSISLYDIKDDIAEVGRVQIGCKEAHGKGIGRTALAMICWFGFQSLNLKTIIASVHQENIAAHKNHMRTGFTVEGKKSFEKGGFEDLVKITGDSLIQSNNFLNEIKINN